MRCIITDRDKFWGFGRHFNGLLFQSSASYAASNIAQVSLTWYVFTVTKSALAVGIVAIVESLVFIIISLPMGVIVDRKNKGLLLFLSGTLGFLAMLGLSGISFFRIFDFYLVLGMAALWGLSREISRSSNFSSLPDLVSRSLQPKANGVFRAVNSSLGSVSNAVAGGIIVAFGVVASFSISTAAYALSAIVSIVFLFPFYRSRVPESVAKSESETRMFQELKEGFRWLICRKGFFLLTLSVAFFNFFIIMAFTFYVVYVARGLFDNSFIYGSILAVLAAGDVIGSLIPGRIDLLRHTGKVNVILFGGVIGLCLLLMGLYPKPYVALASSFFAGLSIGISENLWLTTAHNIVPADMRGEIFCPRWGTHLTKPSLNCSRGFANYKFRYSLGFHCLRNNDVNFQCDLRINEKLLGT